MSKKLFIKHFPSRMTLDERQQFLHSFGALKVQCFPDNGKMKYSCFATFYDEQSATNAMHKLHQLNLFGFRLSVEYANDDKLIANEQLIVNTSTHNVEKDIEFRLKQKWTQLHSISQSLGLNYPFSPILKYKYPKANKATVTNIANALLRNSKFYTQVLHLMNKMNLPPPFEEVGRESRKDDKVISETDSESEIEIDEDLIANNSLVERSDFRRKRKKLEIGFVGPKKDLKRERKNKTTVSASVSDLFEETKTLPHKSVIEINVKHTLQSVQDEVDVNIGGFGIIERKKSDNEDLEINELEISEFITEDELRDNRLTRSEYTQYSVFKNYEPGNQSCRLYVKNLDKKVEVHDLKRIFGKFVDWKSELERNTFHVCLLKEGRMKGQAFITFSNELNAKTALNETNGFKLNGKPMVVCFARSAKVN